MEINEYASKLVKPLTPTPSTLRNYTISFFDDNVPKTNVPLTLYYSTSHKDLQTNIFNHLEISLSKTLVEFYPLAGRYIHHGSFIDCGDQGALYIEAKSKFQLSEFLGLNWKLKSDMLQDFLPCEFTKAGEINDPLLSIKVTTFECGGVAIGMCISHIFADMATFCMFINYWATRSRELDDELELVKYSPLFGSAHCFPKSDLPKKEAIAGSNAGTTNGVLRVFSFKGSAVRKLREILMIEDNVIKHRPSKVLLIEALLWKAFVDIDYKTNRQSKASFVSQAVNLRNVTVPKAPTNFCGNFITLANAKIEFSEGDNMINLRSILERLHDSIKKITSDYAKALSHCEKDYEVLSKPFLQHYENAASNDGNLYTFGSWCRFSFYTADFGWGKPVWRSITNPKVPRTVFLMDDNEGDGVEAWICLNEKQMCEFEQDPNIQAYLV